MEAQQIIVALAVQLAQVMAERDDARQAYHALVKQNEEAAESQKVPGKRPEEA